MEEVSKYGVLRREVFSFHICRICWWK